MFGPISNLVVFAHRDFTAIGLGLPWRDHPAKETLQFPGSAACTSQQLLGQCFFTCCATTAFASRIARPSSLVLSNRSLATFAHSSCSSEVNEEFLAAALDFIDRNNEANTPWFCYFNPTRMHVWTHLKAASEGKTGLGVYPDGMVELDGYVGQLLEKLDALGNANNTIVVFTTDNGAEELSWPDGGTTPFRGEKATNWEGGYRVPMLMRWPGTIQPGTIYNDFIASYDLLPTFVAAAGNPDIVAQCLKGSKIGDKTFKVHLDGYNLIPFFKGEVKQSPRQDFLYWNDDGELVAVRVRDWKIVFKEQDNTGIGVWQGQFTDLRVPKLFNLRADPFERGDQSILYNKWMVDRAFAQAPAQALVAQWLQTFQEFPIRQKPASFNLDAVMMPATSPRRCPVNMSSRMIEP
ncbi:MAG: sulfatase-like hydrolase/transferase [Xanthobacteraceae bacterium]